MDDAVTSDISYASNKNDETSLKKKFNNVYRAVQEAWKGSSKDETAFNRSMTTAFKNIKTQFNKRLEKLLMEYNIFRLCNPKILSRREINF